MEVDQEIEFEARDGLLIGLKKPGLDAVARVTGILGSADVDNLPKRAGARSGVRSRMRTAVDSSVLLDVFIGSGPFLEGSQNALRKAIATGSLVAGEVFWDPTRQS